MRTFIAIVLLVFSTAASASFVQGKAESYMERSAVIVVAEVTTISRIEPQELACSYTVAVNILETIYGEAVLQFLSEGELIVGEKYVFFLRPSADYFLNENFPLAPDDIDRTKSPCFEHEPALQEDHRLTARFLETRDGAKDSLASISGYVATPEALKSVTSSFRINTVEVNGAEVDYLEAVRKIPDELLPSQGRVIPWESYRAFILETVRKRSGAN